MLDFAALHAAVLSVVSQFSERVVVRAESSVALPDGRVSIASSSVAGYLVQEEEGFPYRQSAPALVPSGEPSYIFIPETYGQEPPLNGLVSYGGVERTVASSKPYRTPGGPIYATVSLS